MENRESKILEITNDIKLYNDYEFYEKLLDEMTLNLMLSEESEETKGSAYWMVVNLKKLLKVTCSDFFGYSNLSQISFSHPKTEFEQKLFDTIQNDLNNNPKWDFRKQF
jgi:hypothetical protein